MAANRTPKSQWHVQAEITRVMEMIGSWGQDPKKMFEDMHSTLAENASASSVQAFFRTQNLATNP